MNYKKGKRTIILPNPPSIISGASIVGKKEGEGPLAEGFDYILDDDMWGEKSWEKAESKLQKNAVQTAITKAGLDESEIDFMLGGDLINQCIGASYGLRDFDIPFFGLYGACSTMSESLSIGAMIVSAGYGEKVACVTSSHFCTAEKQFRFPLEYGGQRTPTSQWTVTGSGCAILSRKGEGPYIRALTPGKIIDMGITDANNMGAAMAPAAADTLMAHFKDTGLSPSDYDIIMTGDLGIVGSDILCDLMNKNGYDIYPNHKDAGKMIYDIKNQDVHSGGSGCGCCATVFCSHILKQLKEKKLKRVIVMATGALMNTMSVQQGESIPSIAHAVSISCDLGEDEL